MTRTVERIESNQSGWFSSLTTSKTQHAKHWSTLECSPPVFAINSTDKCQCHELTSTSPNKYCVSKKTRSTTINLTLLHQFTNICQLFLVERDLTQFSVDYTLKLFIARQHTDARIWYSKSVRPSVRLSVCPLRSGIRWKRLNKSSQFFHHTVAQSF